MQVMKRFNKHFNFSMIIVREEFHCNNLEIKLNIKWETTILKVLHNNKIVIDK